MLNIITNTKLINKLLNYTEWMISDTLQKQKK